MSLKKRLERELQGEILAHLELAERDAIASGMSPERPAGPLVSALAESSR